MILRPDDRGAGAIGVLTLLASLVGTAVVGGLISAGLVMPAIGAAGATARGGVGLFEALPAELEQSPLAQQSRILYADGSTLATFYGENRIVVPLSRVAPVMRKAQVAIEDTRFYQHGGVDPRGVMRAAVSNASSSSGTQGASTLTQQYVKLTLQENALYAGNTKAAQAAVAKDVSRKVQEMKYAIALEKKLSKDQILEGYLNIAYFGDGVYGVETAARHYFGIPAAKLSLPQAALLAGIVQLPGPYNPTTHPKAAITRRNVVLARMLQTGAITKAQHDKAVATKLTLDVTRTSNGCDASKAAFFCNYVYQLLTKDKILASTPAASAELVKRGGLTVLTTLDKDMQADATRAIKAKVKARNKSKVAAAISVVEPGSGKVLAMAQSQPYGRGKGQTELNYNVDHGYGGGQGFQVGSTFKAFTLAAALKKGMTLSTIIDAPKGGTEFPAKDFDSKDCWPGQLAAKYPAFNSEGNEHGKKSLRELTYQSVNTGFIRLESRVGVCAVKAAAENLGVHGAEVTLGENGGRSDGITKATDAIRPRPSMTLGSQEIAPLTMAAAYASFAADGMYCAPIAVTSIKTLTGRSIAAPKPSCTRGLDKNVARGVTSALQDVLTKGTAKRVQSLGRPAAGKTGTSNKSWSNFFVGYTPQLASAVWFGHPAGLRSLKNVDTGVRRYPGYTFGATVAAPIWADFMSNALKGEPKEQFGRATDRMINGERVTIPSTFGLSVDEARSRLRDAGFSPEVGDTLASSAPRGAVAGTSPNSGVRAPRGSTVTIYTSRGAQVSPAVLFTSRNGRSRADNGRRAAKRADARRAERKKAAADRAATRKAADKAAAARKTAAKKKTAAAAAAKKKAVATVKKTKPTPQGGGKGKGAGGKGKGGGKG
jgi:membrane peptidoglycan carboxypeptidase